MWTDEVGGLEATIIYENEFTYGGDDNPIPLAGCIQKPALGSS